MRKIFFLCTLALLQCTIAIAQNQGGGNGPKDGQMKLQPFNATCGGGLVLNKDVYDMQPGEALQLINFEFLNKSGLSLTARFFILK